jgi:signal peptidase II
MAGMVVVLDRLTKGLAVGALSGGRTQAVIPGVIDFQLVYNTGAAWGMFEGARVPFLIIAAVAVLAMVLYLLLGGRHTTFTLLGLGLVAGGAVGNAIDRALTGKVVDFIHTLFIDFPLFNVADSAITVGAILFVAALLFGEGGMSGRAPEATAESAAEGLSEESTTREPSAHHVDEEPRDAPL